MSSLQDRLESGAYDRVTVLVDGKEVEVFNWMTVRKQFTVRANQMGAHTLSVEAGDGGIGKPDAVSPELAEELDYHLNIDVADRGIDVIDPTAEEVDLV